MPQKTELTLDDKVFKRLLGVIEQIDTRLTKVSNTTEILRKRSAKIEFKFDGVDNLTKLLDVISRAKINQIAKLIENLEKLSQLNFKSSTVQGFTELSAALAKMSAIDIKPFNNIAKALSILSDSSKLPDVGKVIKNLTKLGEAFSKLSSASVQEANFAKILSGLTQLSRFSTIEDVTPVVKAIGSLGAGIKKLFDSLSKVKLGSSAKLGAFLLSLQTVLGLVGAISKRLPGNNTIRELSLTLERLGIGMSGLFRHIDKIDVGNSKKLAALLTGLVLGFNVLSRFAGNTEKLKALGTAFSGVASLFDAVFKGIDIKNVGKSKSITKVLSDRVKFVVDILRQLKGIRGANLGGVGEAFQGVGAIFRSLSEIDDEKASGGISNKTVESLRNVIRAFKELSGLKVNKNAADALKGLGQIFSSQGFDALKQQAGKAGGGIGTHFGRSLLDEFFKIQIAKTIARVFLGDLNPAVLLAKFSSSFIQTFVTIDTRVTQILNNLVTKIKGIGSSLTGFGTNLINSFGLDAITGSQGFAIATEFDDLANRAQVFGDLSEDQLKTVLDLSDAIGIKYPLSANEALKAIIDLQKAGLGVGDLQGAVSPIADLTALSESGDIQNISRIVIQAVSSFAELREGVVSSFDNTAVVADILSAAADNSTASVESLGAGLANVGPLATQFGLTMEETVAVLGLFEDRGIRGAEAGTQLRSLLSNLTRPTEAVKGKLNELGVSLVDQQGNFRSLNDIINDINKSFTETKTVTISTSNLTDEQSTRLDAATKAYAKASAQIIQYNDGLVTGALNTDKANAKVGELTQVQANAAAVIAEITGSQSEAERITLEITRTQQQNFEAIQTIFGTFGQQGAAILIGEGTDAIQNFIDETGRFPTAAERAQQLLDTFGATVDQIKGSFETLLKNVFLPLIDTIFRPLANVMLAFVNTLLTIDGELLATAATAATFGAALASILGTALVITGGFITFGAAILGVVTPLLTFTGVLSILATALGSFLAFLGGLAAFAVIAGPLVLILTALASGFRSLIKIFSTNVGGASDALTALKDSLGLVFSAVGNVATSISNLLGIVFGGGDASLESVGQTFSNIFNGLAAPAKTFAANLNRVGSAISLFAGFFQNGILSQTSADSFAANPLIKFLLDKSGLEATGDNVRVLFGNLRSGLNQLKGAFTQIGNAAAGFFTILTSGGGIDQALAFAQQSLTAGFSKIGSLALQTIQGLFGVDLVNEIKLLDAGKIGEAIASLIGRAIEGVKTLILNNREGISSFLTSLFSFLFTPGKLATALFDFLGLTEIGDVFREVERVLTGLFGGIVDTLFNLLAGDDLATAIRKSFGSGVEPIILFVETLGNLVSNVVGLFGDLFAALFPGGGQAIAEFNLLDVVTNVLNTLSAGLKFLSDNIILPLRDLIRSIDFKSIFDFVGNLVSQFAEFFRLLFAGDFSGALDQAGNIGETIGKVIQDLLANVFDIKLTPNANIIQQLAEVISGLLSFALDGIAGLLGFDSFTSLGQTILNGVGTAISEFLGDNPAAKFAGIATDILQGLADAVMDGFLTIGDLLNLDTTNAEETLKTAFQGAIDNIRDFFLNDNETTIFDNIGTIFSKIGEAIQTVVDIFSGNTLSEGSENVATFQDVLQGIFDFVSNLVSLGLETLTAPLAGIGDFIQALSELDSNKIGIIAAAIAGIGGTLVLLNPAVAAGISSVVSSLLRFGGLASIVLTIKNIAENGAILVDAIDSLLDLDVASAAGKLVDFGLSVATGITFDILGLFGIDTIFGQTEADVRSTVEKLAGGVDTLLVNVGNGIINFINGVKGVIEGIRDTIDRVIQIATPFISVIGTIIFSPVILFIKAVQSFAELPQEKKDKIAVVFTAIAVALALYNGQAILAGIGTVVSFIGTLAGVGGGAAAAGAGALASKVTVLATALGSFAKFLAGTVVPIGIILLAIASAINNADKLFDVFFNIISLIGSIISLDLTATFDSLGGIFSSIIDFIGSTVLDAVFTIAEFFGITEIAGKTKDEFILILGQLVFTVKSSFIAVGQSLSTFFTQVFNDLGLKLNILGADIELAVSDAAARIRTIGSTNPEDDPFFKAAAVFDPKTFSIDNLSAAVGDSTISQDDLDRFSRKNAGLILSALQTSLVDETQFIDTTEFGKVLGQLDLSGSVDDFAKNIVLSGDQELKNRFFTEIGALLAAPGDQRIITQDQANAIIGAIVTEVQAGTLPSDEALNILNLLPLGGEGQLSAEQREAAIKQINDIVAKYQALVDEGAALQDQTLIVDPDVEIVPGNKGGGADFTSGLEAAILGPEQAPLTPTVPVSPFLIFSDPTQTKDDFITKAEEAIAGAGGSEPITPEIPLAPTFVGIESEEDVDALVLNFQTLNDNILIAKTSFDEFATKINDNITNLNLLSTTVTTTSGTFTTETTNIQTVWTTLNDFLTNSLNTINGGLRRIPDGLRAILSTLTLINPLVSAQLVLLQTAFMNSSTSIARSLEVVIGKLKGLRVILDEVLGKLATVGASDVGGGSGTGVAGGLAEGGPVFPGIFEILEKNEPEILFQNGRAFLLSPGGGAVRPALPTAGIPTFGGIPATQNVPNGAIGSGSNSFSIQEGDINITIQGNNLPGEVLAAQVRDLVREEQSNRDIKIRERLRTSGRS
jgi:TP901 family phage tail tape measure protein